VIKVNPGKLNKRITFQSFNPDATNENGFPISTDQQWSDLKTVWAMVKTLKGREYYQAAAIQAENTTRFVIRYTTGIDNTMRIKYGTRIFEIVAPPINDDERNMTLTIITKEVIE
jgi:SPP1 family predicted phage head-tail adaptor